MACLERHYYEYGDIPSVAKTAESTGLTEDQIRGLWKTKEFQEDLVKKGIHFKTSTDTSLTVEQVMVANALLNTLDKMSTKTLLKGLGISDVKYQAWLRDPAYAAYLRKRSEQMFENMDFMIYKALIQQIERGDMKAIDRALELRGIWNPKLEVNINIESVLVRVVDIIAKHVQDPNTLEAIATDLDQLNAQDQARRTEFGTPIPASIGRGDPSTD